MFLEAWKLINQQMTPLEFGGNIWYDNSEDAQHNLASQVGWRLTWEDSETHWKDLDGLVETGSYMHRYLHPYLSVTPPLSPSLSKIYKN